LVGVDGSAKQISRACLSVPEAEFIHADMTEVELGLCCFDAIGTFYSITHVSSTEHGDPFHRISG